VVLGSISDNVVSKTLNLAPEAPFDNNKHLRICIASLSTERVKNELDLYYEQSRVIYKNKGQLASKNDF